MKKNIICAAILSVAIVNCYPVSATTIQDTTIQDTDINTENVSPRASYKAYVNENYVYFRTSPSVESWNYFSDGNGNPIYLMNGDTISVTKMGLGTTSDTGHRWAYGQVQSGRLKGKWGYVNEKYIDIDF
ncbi:hypothetical protein [Clostridium butyricum]|uniref:SH3b domain-containing protein n=2 Tax=Clostridium butyricum TaxID=1492 RepID=C4IEG7_CLOBU|nr:hypothetical protein [Clostridium butyricum]EDT73491.1 hypothetical protein CBY_1257 [Clostridium butyricum 5521]EEP55091.1 hypothetical protein CLP_3761 [Clostridium butyricum E4 str. BoNT E BL5262]KHD13689.1 hypothetical protein OA81_19465 [Clostridium butyricum]NFL31664.1 hypothetical protein [Clostridium butyricum]NFS19678.1 hypothetical protein [Clostridium butyricum]